MLREFIKEYKQKFSPTFKSGFWGDIAKICTTLKDPGLHPSIRQISVLNELVASEYEALKIAVIGQFSSGKSTFLNTLLGSQILPTGVVPVTAKPTYIKYAPYQTIDALYEDGRKEIVESSKINDFVDQRGDMKNIKSISIFAPNEILRKICFIDTPGLNSNSTADTRETLNIFSEVFGVLWISLIDNAARASEIEQISLLPKFLKDNSIAILSQKDRLSQSDIERVLGYAKENFKERFSDVVAVSSRLEQKGDANSGFSQIKEFLNGLENRRKEFAKIKLNMILDLLRGERENFISIYDELEKIILSQTSKMENFIDENLDLYEDEFSKIYAKIKELSNFISEILNASLSSQTRVNFRLKKGVLSKNNYEKIEYEAPYFNVDEALSKLIYNDDRLNVTFRKFRGDLKKFEDKIILDFENLYKNFENEILLFKGKYESLERQDEFYSLQEISFINKIAGEVYELFLKDYERLVFEINQKIRLFFEKIMIKIATNYINAVILTANFINDKITRSIRDYEEDGVGTLYYPSFDDFEKVLLNNLHYYEFENEFVGSSSFIKRISDDFIERKESIKNLNLEKISAFKSSQISALDKILLLKNKLDHLEN